MTDLTPQSSPSESPSSSSGLPASPGSASSINSLSGGRETTRPHPDYVALGWGKTPPKSPPPVLTNPVGLAPTGSPPGKLCAVDGVRTMLAGLSVYGFLQGVNHILEFVGSSAAVLPKYGAEIAAVAVALFHLTSAILADNTPRPAAEPPRLP